MTEKRALIVDDEPDIRELLEITLGRMNVDTRSAQDVASAKELLANERFDLCLTDMQLPDGNGIDLVQHIASNHSEVPVAMITAFGSMDTAIAALKAGAFDFVQKPVDLEQLRKLVDTALKLQPMAAVEGPDAATGATQMLGDSPAMARLRGQIKKLARSQAPIYISGESGAGKEVAARMIHEQGPRSVAPFVPVNCGAIPSELMESEFFGHQKGSFTGAVNDKEGLFQAASGGTLFLDEVADLPLPMQVKLLRAIQEKAVRPVGAQTEAPIDVRVLSATHKDLAREVERGNFRQDLYYRINVIELKMPSLRERKSDIAELAELMLGRLATEYGSDQATLHDSAMEVLQGYDFPGNVRELENILERAYTLCDGTEIHAADLHLSPAARSATPAVRSVEDSDDLDDSVDDDLSDFSAELAPGQGPSSGESLEDYLEGIEKGVIMEALEATRWNKTAAAKRLGITFRALRYRLKKLGLE